MNYLYRMRLPTSAVLSVIVFCITAASCQKKTEPIAQSAAGGTYFSIKQFMADQFDTHRSQPFVFMKIVSDGEQTDSTYVAADTMAWTPVIDAFAAADISDSALVGQYKYSEFDEGLTGQHMFLYEAADPDLKTRQLMIGADPFTGKILSVYTEVQQPNGKTEKLYYAPLKLIQIQTFTGRGSKARNLRVEYHFPQPEKEEADVYIP